MSTVGQREKVTQKRVVQFFEKTLGYTYLGDWSTRDNHNIEKELLMAWLKQQGYSDTLINRALHQLEKASSIGEGRTLYGANEVVYQLLRYGIKVKEQAGENHQTLWLIDWRNLNNNQFAIAEEVTVQGGEFKKRPDLVLYINGIAIAVIELKRSSVGIAEGIRQNLDNQKEAFIQKFFTTIQLVMAGNDSQGIRYGTIQTPEKYYLQWKEPPQQTDDPNPLDNHLYQLCRKERLLEIIHNFIVFDAGAKKTCRHNQYFGIKAAQQYITKREGGIIWHTQGSGKSLTMVWLAKWIKENIQNSRVLIITDRTELDEQIEKVFLGVSEDIYRTKNGADLIATLNHPNPWLICSLIHKFGHQNEASGDKATNEFIAELKNNLPPNFMAKGDVFVFVDECHRTQSGKLHDAMKLVLPNALFIGFTGTPLLKTDKKTSQMVFGSFIHTYKYDEAVKDKVVLDLRYEARDIDQYINNPEKIDLWFESKTKGLSGYGKSQLKREWGSLKKLHSSEPRLKRIADDIILDMATKPRLEDGRGNALLVCSSVYQACVIYKIMQDTELADHCAIVTSYAPTAGSIKGEETGDGKTEAIKKYDIYRQMLARYFKQTEEAASRVEEFEKEVKRRFIKEPAQMRLLIVVDKLLTGFDAPSATYLYIDKSMQDHGLFQAICRVNRLDGDDKDYGYIVDYRDLFNSLENAIHDYTSGAFDNYDKEDVAGLLKNRLIEGKNDLEEALEEMRALCEPIPAPKALEDYLHYFAGVSGNNQQALLDKEPLRIAFYKQVSKLTRAYMEMANDLLTIGYSADEAKQIQARVVHYQKAKLDIQQASGDWLDRKSLEPAMRRLLDMYVNAEETEILAQFDELGLVDLILNLTPENLAKMEKTFGGNKEAMSEAIENNIRKKIVDETPINPKYYEKMSILLDELIELRRKQAIDYKAYLQKIKELAKQTFKPEAQTTQDYPQSMDSLAKRALYDNLGKDELLVIRIDTAIRHTKKADWVGNRFKEKELRNAIKRELGGTEYDLEALFELVKMQREYH